jgi:outer membrane protein assembly factor BamB
VESVDQLTIRRSRRLGLTAIDEQKCYRGYTLFCAWIDGAVARLIDSLGETVHFWRLPYLPAFWSYLLPNGNLFSLGRTDNDGVVVVEPNWGEKGGILYEMDREGNVVWEHRDPYQHHDGRRTVSGGAIYLTVERVPNSIAAKVQGGIPGSDEHGMWADVIVEVDAAGNRVWEWHAHEHLDPEVYILPANVRRDEWTHGNTVVPVDDRSVMVSFRHLSTVAIIDKGTKKIRWKLGPDVVSGQHDPSILENGNVLVFDNGLSRRDTHATFSRVIEVDTQTNEIMWEYHDAPSTSFYSPFNGGARRLPNGNTHITESWYGRMFQVTRNGEVVWEYVNPDFFNGRMNVVFRSTHYSREEVAHLL